MLGDGASGATLTEPVRRPEFKGLSGSPCRRGIPHPMSRTPSRPPR